MKSARSKPSVRSIRHLHALRFRPRRVHKSRLNRRADPAEMTQVEAEFRRLLRLRLAVLHPRDLPTRKSHEPPSRTQHRLERTDRMLLRCRPVSARPAPHAASPASVVRPGARRRLFCPRSTSQHAKGTEQSSRSFRPRSTKGRDSRTKAGSRAQPSLGLHDHPAQGDDRGCRVSRVRHNRSG